MFHLVDDIDAYAGFLPWCGRSEVLSRTETVVEARLEMHRGPVSQSFTTRNTHSAPDAIDIALIGGPFRHLAGGWRFRPLGDAGSKVTLELEFEFESRALDAVIGAFFEETCNSLVDAFTARAIDVFGPR
jgi:ribosome-associated toxin RatA of RatAB toxin-antitoxin module